MFVQVIGIARIIVASSRTVQIPKKLSSSYNVCLLGKQCSLKFLQLEMYFQIELTQDISPEGFSFATQKNSSVKSPTRPSSTSRDTFVIFHNESTRKSPRRKERVAFSRGHPVALISRKKTRKTACSAHPVDGGDPADGGGVFRAVPGYLPPTQVSLKSTIIFFECQYFSSRFIHVFISSISLEMKAFLILLFHKSWKTL